MRIRSTKPEFWRSDDVDSLDWHTRLVFLGLWSYVDDNGVGRDRLSDIVADLFAGDLSRDPQETLRRVSAGLDELSARGLVARYSVDGHPYLCITGWRHQRIEHPAKPRYPTPSDLQERKTRMRSSGESPESLMPGTEEQRNRGTEEQRKRLPPRRAPEHPLSDSWAPNERHREIARTRQVDVGHEADQFRSHAKANDRRQRDWDAAFRLWLGKARPPGRPAVQTAPTPTPPPPSLLCDHGRDSRICHECRRQAMRHERTSA